ncbi:MAG: MBL fold metallo-hydrolase [Desulfofustis sp. PB-SRB1]|jgi:glyoxylase-like metal-dependent hydrolase (beta-lactamase superfamily II)|nr:MBL fold metallo-hydrolase [Desulfofustis sp. PB-SRB1]MBM1001488.1 MBL fold metallo-hydrolase [Desulfofustis sp. PB-SRB1]HBH28176.1 MBL fold metallo-hydrolase [Desulfofustis sp.]HBH31367.1 MBL fold metallo-hydrolase [Desulfofustis sp.]
MTAVQPFFDDTTFTMTYVVYDDATKDATIIDPVWDYDPLASRMSSQSVQKVIDFVSATGLNPHLILETHAHADHLSGAQLLKKAYPQAKLGIGEHITIVQETFKPVFGLPDGFKTDGSQFDLLLSEGSSVRAGSLRIDVLYTPGHTPACSSYLIGDMVFTGDAMFMPDSGTGRCDFPRGSATDLYSSITQKLYTLPDSTRVFVGHDYQPKGRELAFETTIAEEKKHNIQLPVGRSEEQFVEFRSTRDATLSMPKLIFQSVQVNINAGAFYGADEKSGFLHIPVTFS